MAESPCVLLVNDFADEREMYAEGFRAYGYRPLSASTAETAYTVVEGAHPSVVITDIALGGAWNGVDLTRRLKADERTRELPVIVLTARFYQRDREDAVHAGCDLFLKKPCLPESLAQEVRALLERSRELRASALQQQERARLICERAERAVNRSEALAAKFRRLKG